MKITLNSAYKEARKTNKRYRIIYGGAGSGKSHYVGQEALLNMLSSKEYHYLVVRKTGKSIRNSVFSLLTTLIDEYELRSYFNVNKTEMSITCVSGSTLITSGLDDVEKLKSVANVNRLWVEEASEITEKDFNQLDLRLRGTSKVGYQLTLTFNPISELHWIKKLFFDIGKKNSFILKTTYKDNSHLDDNYINTLNELKKQDYQYFRVYALGEWGSTGNMVYNNWEKQDLSGIMETFDNHRNGLDFGFSQDPNAVIRTHYDPKRKTIYIIDELYETEQHLDDLAIKLEKMIGHEYITCDSSEPRSIADLKRKRIKAKGAKKGAGSIEHGIKWLKSHKIIVHEDCINTIKELSSYRWKEDKDGNVMNKPSDMNNHLLDALRYAYEDDMRYRTMRATKRI